MRILYSLSLSTNGIIAVSYLSLKNCSLLSLVLHWALPLPSYNFFEVWLVELYHSQLRSWLGRGRVNPFSTKTNFSLTKLALVEKNKTLALHFFIIPFKPPESLSEQQPPFPPPSHCTHSECSMARKWPLHLLPPQQR